MRKKWRTKRCEEEEELQLSKMEIIKHCIMKNTSWSYLQSDMLLEIKKRLYFADHIRFSGVCKSWLAVQHEKRAADVLPWLMVLHEQNNYKISYKLYQHPYNTTDNSTIISGSINLGYYFKNMYHGDVIQSVTYLDGWLFISVYSLSISYFLLYSHATKASFTLPQFNHCPFLVGSRLCLAMSTSPASPDCVFLALDSRDHPTRMIHVYRYGDTRWTTIKFDGGGIGKPKSEGVVFIRGVFYFLISSLAIGYYDLATRALTVESFSTVLELFKTHKLFELDGNLVLTYYDKDERKFSIRKYDWSNKVWVPMQSLGDRSVYLSSYSVYVDRINYHGISQANKIYVREDYDWPVNEYTLEDGQQLRCTSAIIGRLARPYYHSLQYPIWVDPPDVLMKLGDTLHRR